MGMVMREAQMVGSPGQIDVLVLKATASQTKPLRDLNLSYWLRGGKGENQEVYKFLSGRSLF